MERGEALIRVERGRPDEVETAAVVAVLLALRADAGGEPEEPSAAEMRWWLKPDAYTAPDSWR
ncbi:acyl-CoA carboxylase epsilon subunit [Streptomyces sp. NBC_01483]|uniref:acyl-CoA carboxylase epsilon subunit n=1 Tax=Streptomyces sp. NBC_01483 TaxID=2903883 RepID=UPI002E36C4A9|nr:acyl-CoA carboxylase epsilon subunit [Streptomyces sp. NBC_01483]